MSEFDGVRALVTGASRGIGLDCARALAERGADVAIAGRDPAKAPEALTAIKEVAPGRTAIFEQTDLWVYEDVARMAERVIDRLGAVDLLVVSGGSLEKVPGRFFLDIDPATFVDYAHGQWLSRMYAFRAVAEHLVERGSGSVVFLGTDAGRIPTPGVSLPGGSGAALVMSTKVLAQEFSRHGIRVNTVSLTVTRDTPGLDDVLGEPAAAKVFQKAVERQPFPVYGDDIAEAVLYFASPRASGITGQTLSVNGGLSYPG